MKTILVDAWNTFVKNNTIDSDIYKILESYENQKIILVYLKHHGVLIVLLLKLYGINYKKILN